MQISKNILVAPLNWGLGHATRCIPIIRRLIKNGFSPILASDGSALALLKKEFPGLPHITLPSYGITYPENGELFKLKLLKDSPKIWFAIRREHEMLDKIVEEHDLVGIISDNRLGLYHDMVPTVFVTHQLQVFSGNTTWLSTQLHLYFIRKFGYCWIPDYEDERSLSGNLSHSEDRRIRKRFIGPLSRFTPSANGHYKFDLLVLLSGPEPQRSILEEKVRKLLTDYDGKVLLVRGKVKGEAYRSKKNNLTTYNYLPSDGLQKALQMSKLVLCRSGYSSIMDLAKMGKKAYFIPTPGQYEQEYLADRLSRMGIAPFCAQDDFTLEKLAEVEDYSGLSCSSASGMVDASVDEALFEAFSSVKLNSEPIPGSLST